jgi:LuxR family transcriptional regulator, maltose regulon positive regulatory protein
MVMETPLLETKLHMPAWRPDMVARPSLIERLERGATSRLTLVSAPAGFGKTTVLAEWLAATRANGRAVAWLSLDAGDNHSVSFWTYVITALQETTRGGGSSALSLWQSSQAPIEAVLTTLINELAAAPNDIVLVLDDYHVIEAREIHEGVAYLLERVPPHIHFVIATRADPALPLARLRASGELVEIRAADLRFTQDEALAYLNGVMGLGLTRQDISALEERTEGWVAALQLAALSMQNRADPASFIAGFAGDDRYVVDYLVEEVLLRQPPQVREFLLETSILSRLSGPLCDAVTGRDGGKGMLETLDRANLFVVPLDDRRHWYRYHHLFSDVLRVRLLGQQPQEVQELHSRASRWFEQNDELPQAVRHAFAAADFNRAAALVEHAIPEMLRSRQDATLRAWFEALPDELVRLRPVLGAGYAGLLLHSGEFDSVPDRLRDAEQCLKMASHVRSEEQGPWDASVFVDEAQFRELPGMIALYRAGHAQVVGSLHDTVKYARLALELMQEDAPLRGGAMALLGLALWSSGDIEEAHKTYAEGIARVHLGGYVNDSSTITLADMQIAQGRLRDALRTYQRSLQLAEAQGRAAPRGTADLHVGISEIYREQDELDTATEHLERSKELGESAALPENRYRWFTAMAGVRQAQGDWDGALDLLNQAGRLYAGGFSPNARPIPAMKARVWIVQGRLAEAFAWAREQTLSPSDELSYLREFEHITLARLLLAQAATGQGADSMADAVRLLMRLLCAAEEGGRTGNVIEILVLQAVAYQTKGDTASALTTLERALALAEPEGYVRIFIDEVRHIAVLLEALTKRAAGDFVRALLAGLHGSEGEISARRHGYGLLSERELEVIRLLRSDLSGPDIARELVVSLNTMRTHTKSIYAKLGVNSRRAAVRRAEELHLL